MGSSLIPEGGSGLAKLATVLWHVHGGQHIEKVKEMWAYQTTMIGEARQCGGRGWTLYDSAFRQRVASLTEVDFSRFNQSLYSTTFLAYGGRGRFCPSCSMSDQGFACVPAPARPCFSWNDGKCIPALITCAAGAMGPTGSQHAERGGLARQRPEEVWKPPGNGKGNPRTVREHWAWFLFLYCHLLQ